MTTETNLTEHEHPKRKEMGQSQGGGSGAVYGIGLIGAWVYYFKRATTTQERVMGILKGFAWPALLVYELFMFLNKE